MLSTINPKGVSLMIRGWSDAATLEAAARPILDAFWQTHRRSPTIPELRAQGHGWLVSATYRYSPKTYVKFLARLGFPRPVHHRPPPLGQRVYGYWCSDDNVRQELRIHFPDLWAWRICPSYHLLRRELGGLAKYVTRHHGVSALARRLDLLPYWVGCRQRRRVEAVAWVLSFYQNHRRWPVASECPTAVRDLRFVRGTTWLGFCRPRGLARTPLEKLIGYLTGHVAWLRQHQPAELLHWIPIREDLATERAVMFSPAHPSTD